LAGNTSDSIIEQVREAADIVEVVQQYFPLAKSGKDFKARCPFHEDKAPSFYVVPDKQIYYCFGCGAGGNVFNFIMQYENVTFRDALEVLAKRYGIELPRFGGRESSEAELTYRVNALAARAYRAALLNTKEGLRARDYVRSRGIPEAIENDFLIGYCPSDGRLMVGQAQKKGIALGKLVELGLASSWETGVRDRFHKRLIFPIPNPTGKRVLAFGARVLDDSLPKYINSPETAVFKKARTLYGLHRARREIGARGMAIIVEGYLDVIALHMNDIGNAVASLGTAFTFGQAKNLSRFCPEVVFMYDGDQAGKIASLRGCAAAAEAGLKIRVVRLPDGDDPDSFVRKRGPDEVRSLIENGAHYVDFILSETSPREKEEAVRLALGIMQRIGDPTRRSIDLRLLYERTGIPEYKLEQTLAGLRTPGGWSGVEEKGGDAACDKIEKSLVSILVGMPQYAETIFEEISPSDLSDARTRAIAELISDRRSRGLPFDAAALLSGIEDEPTRRLLAECSLELDADADAEKMVSDHITFVVKRRIGRQIDELRRQIYLAEKEGDAERLSTLLSKRQGLAEKLRTLST
jgi:DNA primase